MMVDEYTDMQAAWDATGVSESAAAAAQEADLINTGTYDGQIIEIKPRVVDKLGHALNGKTVARLTAELFVDGAAKRIWFDVLPELVYNVKGLPHDAFRRASELASATGTVGQPFNTTLRAAMNSRLKFTLRKGKASNGYPARNWLTKISVSNS